MTTPSIEVFAAKLDSVQSDVSAIKVRLDTVSEALVTLTRLEERHDQTTQEIQTLTRAVADQDRRLGSLERDHPGLLEVRRWIISGVVAGVAMIGLALAKLVILDPITQQRMLSEVIQQHPGAPRQPTNGAIR